MWLIFRSFLLVFLLFWQSNMGDFSLWYSLAMGMYIFFLFCSNFPEFSLTFPTFYIWMILKEVLIKIFHPYAQRVPKWKIARNWQSTEQKHKKKTPKNESHKGFQRWPDVLQHPVVEKLSFVRNFGVSSSTQMNWLLTIPIASLYSDGCMPKTNRHVTCKRMSTSWDTIW